MRSGVNEESLNVVLFLASQTPQQMRGGMLLRTSSLDVSPQVFYASMKFLCLQSILKPKSCLVFCQIFKEKGKIMNRCEMESSTFLHNMHQLGLSLCPFHRLSQVGTLFLIKHHRNNLVLDEHASFHIDFHLQSRFTLNRPTF